MTEGTREAVVSNHFELVYIHNQHYDCIVSQETGKLSTSRIKNKERPLGEVKWAWHRKSRGTWVGPCNHLDTWVGPCDHLNTWVGLSFLELLVIAVQSTANVQKPEVGGAGHVNARHGWGWT